MRVGRACLPCQSRGIASCTARPAPLLNLGGSSPPPQQRMQSRMPSPTPHLCLTDAVKEDWQVVVVVQLLNVNLEDGCGCGGVGEGGQPR